MRFGVLGPLAVWDEEGEPVTVPELKVRALLAALVAQDGDPVAADTLIHHLWGDHPPGKPAGALQAKISQLRRILGRDRIVRQPPGYLLRLDGALDLDAARFRDLVARARSTVDPSARASLLTEALDLWRGAAFADFADEEFVRSAAHRLTELRLSVVEEQAKARLEAGDHALAVGELASVVAAHPLRESLRAVQMRALYLTGRQSEALTSYEDLRARLAEELGIDPSPELRALHQAVLRQDAELGAPRENAAEVVARPVQTNLPNALTPLVGREKSLARLAELRSAARLVTLTGPGGVGKSSLAVAAAAQEALLRPEEFPDGVWFVEFAGLRSAAVADLAQVVAAVLGIRDDAPALPGSGGGATTSVQRLATALRDRRTLLVLDNCEHVIDAAAELTDLLLRTARGLAVLVTSQEPLGLAGEGVFGVDPLPRDDAHRLFVTRAAASAPGFPSRLEDCDPADLAAVAEICHRLDGIPLALELAATRVRALGVRELAVRLSDRFSILTLGQRGAPARQQTLRAMIDWSWELLSAPERIVLRRLAVASDGCDLGAAEEVCAGDGVTRAEVLDLVTRLVDRSLVVVAEGPAGRRYRLLESVSAYATERLHEMADFTSARDRHLRHYLAVAERAEPLLRGAEQRVWLTRLDADAGNLRAALDHAGGSAEAVRLVQALSWWWLLRGRLTEGRRALAAVLATRPAGQEPELAALHSAFALLNGDHAATVATDLPARASWLCAYGLFSAGDVARSHEMNTRALARFTAEDDRWGVAASLGLGAMLALVRGDLAALGHDGRRSAELFRDLGDRWGEMQTIPPLATLAEIKGDYAYAARLQHEGLAIAQELGLQAEVAARLSGLGRLALLDRDWDRARDLHQRAHRSAVDHGYSYGQIHAEMGLALGARRCGDLDAAEHHLTRIRDDHAELSSPAGDHLLCAEFGFLAELRGDPGTAAAHHLRGLELARELAEPRALALSLEGLAGASPDPERAAVLLGAADAARRSVDAPLPPAERGDVDRITAAARSALGDEAFTRAFERGAGLSVEEALSS
ncbi:BTAD domain-containing putative transcriptional regulator [Lentzea sp. NBRC 102530]|uniref:BTAD domain-containing putative transcriptional regulator n=1 Tax=Lentzea sp. NBRC 102530 TaxID=3032201 RepID=UPI0024A38C12|nr:BTAD domain-containing putative transcriptional regulator [Lentzea sp. NBRC 102530]GLY48982.1 SARP family transcriptional regulator [Lentzea sp. NBRC 102530]